MKPSVKILLGISSLFIVGILSTRIWVEACTKNHSDENNLSQNSYPKALPITVDELNVSGNVNVIICNKNPKQKGAVITADSSKIIAIQGKTVTIKIAQNKYNGSKVFIYNWIPVIIHTTDHASVTLDARDKPGFIKAGCLNSSEINISTPIDSVEANADLKSRININRTEKYAKININGGSTINLETSGSCILTGKVNQSSICHMKGNITFKNLTFDESSFLDKH